MKALIIRLSLVTFLCSFGAALPGSNPCSRGPGHWCSSLTAARTCGALAHCSQLWSRSSQPQSDPTDDTDTCATCRLLADDLISLAANGVDRMLSAGATACSLVAEPDAARSCRRLLKAPVSLPELLAAGLQPGKACALAGQCRQRQLATTSAGRLRHHRQAIDERRCTACPSVLEAIASTVIQIRVSPARAVARLRDQICPGLASQSERTTCLQLAGRRDLFNIVLQLAKGSTPKQVCTNFQLCSNSAPMIGHPVVQLMRLQTGNKKLPAESIECQLCETLVNQARQMLRDGRTQAEIESFVETVVCNNMAPSAKDQCIGNVKHYGPIILQLLASKLDPLTVCQALGACGKTSKTLHRTENPRSMPKPKASPQCLLCEFVIRELDQQLGQNATQAEVEAALERVCSLLPQTIRQECNSFVQQYTPIIIQLLVNGLSPERICSAIGLCASSSLHRLPPIKTSLQASPQCLICEFVIREVDKQLSQNATQAEIESALVRVCSFLPQSVRQECDSFVQVYTPIIIQFLVNGITPERICTTLGLCTSSSLHRMPTIKKSVQAGPQCLICEFVIREVDKQLGQNATQAEIEAALQKVCSLLPQSVRQECDNFVQQFTPTIVQLLLNGLSPQKVCTALGLCSQQSPLHRLAPLKTRKPSSTVCDVCQTVVQYSKSLLLENSTEEEIIQVLERVCSFLPTAEQPACKSFINEYGAYVIQLLLQDVNPRQICQLIGLCTARQSAPKLTFPRRPIRASPQCLLCEFVIRELDQQLGQNATQAEVEAALERVCSLLPQTIRQECNSFVQQYTPIIIQLLVNGLSPERICSAIGLCSQVKQPLLTTRALPPVKSASCDTCQTVVVYIKTLLKKNATEQEIIETVEKVCNFLPTAERATCKMFVDQYGPYVIQLLLQDLNPTQVCQLIGLCPQKSVPTASAVHKPAQAGPQCLICEFVIREVDKQLGQNATQAEVEAALQKVCSLLPQSVRQECDNFVQQFTPTIVQLLLNGLSPQKVCTALGLCSQRFAVPKKTRVSSSTACDVCQTVVQYAKSLLQANATEEEIVQLLERVCSFLPAAEQSACKSFISQYGPYVIKLLLQEDPREICQLLGLCTSKLQPARQWMLRDQTLRYVQPARGFPATANGFAQMLRNGRGRRIEPVV